MAYTDLDVAGLLIDDRAEDGTCLRGRYPGTPPSTAGEFAPGAQVTDTANNIVYLNTGTTASPVWDDMDSSSTADIADGSVTPVKTAQTEAVTATADGLTTGIISVTARHVTVTSASANNIITLPASVVGKVITGYVGANGCEMRTTAGSSIKINDVVSGSTNEAAIPATTLFQVSCVSSTEWILTAVDELGAVITAIVPDAV